MVQGSDCFDRRGAPGNLCSACAAMSSSHVRVAAARLASEPSRMLSSACTPLCSDSIGSCSSCPQLLALQQLPHLAQPGSSAQASEMAPGPHRAERAKYTLHQLSAPVCKHPSALQHARQTGSQA